MLTFTFGWAAMYSSARACHRLLPGSLFWMCHQSISTCAADGAADGAADAGRGRWPALRRRTARSTSFRSNRHRTRRPRSQAGSLHLDGISWIVPPLCDRCSRCRSVSRVAVAGRPVRGRHRWERSPGRGVRDRGGDVGRSRRRARVVGDDRCSSRHGGASAGRDGRCDQPCQTSAVGRPPRPESCETSAECFRWPHCSPASTPSSTLFATRRERTVGSSVRPKLSETGPSSLHCRAWHHPSRRRNRRNGGSTTIAYIAAPDRGLGADRLEGHQRPGGRLARDPPPGRGGHP